VTEYKGYELVPINENRVSVVGPDGIYRGWWATYEIAERWVDKALAKKAFKDAINKYHKGKLEEND